MNAIELLKQDHRRVRALFSEFAGLGERALVEKRTVADKIFSELDVHTQIEEEIFYPVTRDGATSDETKELIAEAYEEHQVAKGLISELRAGAPGDEQWDAKMKVLQESIEHHVEEEESELLPKARTALGATYMTELGERMAARKRELTAPSSSLGGSLVKMVTRAYDSLTGNGKTTRTKKTATSATRARRAAARTVKKATGSRPVRAAKKAATRGKKRGANVRARAAKVVKTARKRTGKARRSARR